MLNAVNHSAHIYQATDPHFSAESDSEAAVQKIDGSEPTTSQRNHSFSTQGKSPAGNNQKDTVELSKEAEEIRMLQLRDQEVRAHEAAHAAAGGAYAGSPTYSFERGPDGRTYATGGSVSIDISPVAGDPQATLKKAQQVRSAALAPAQPSGQDMKVAQQAQAMAADARIEIAQQRSEDLKSTRSESGSNDDSMAEREAFIAADSPQDIPPVKSAGSSVSGIAQLSLYS